MVISIRGPGLKLFGGVHDHACGQISEKRRGGEVLWGCE